MKQVPRAHGRLQSYLTTRTPCSQWGCHPLPRPKCSSRDEKNHPGKRKKSNSLGPSFQPHAGRHCLARFMFLWSPCLGPARHHPPRLSRQAHGGRGCPDGQGTLAGQGAVLFSHAEAGCERAHAGGAGGPRVAAFGAKGPQEALPPPPRPPPRWRRLTW